jgi:translocation and assembly module TamB
VTVTDGQLVFFGNTYTVTTGNVNFYDPTAINPNLNVSLQTNAQGVNVTIGVTGPMNDLKLSYRSDPPLTFEQIVQLLATNTTPSNPVIAAHQPTPQQQSLSQMGESAVLGQAVANPLASRVQRVFGLTQFKIDPSFSGSNGQPSARVTLQQKIASNITFTYITDVSQTNAQIVRVQWDMTNNLSAVGLRDFNGNVSIEFFYKFKRR